MKIHYYIKERRKKMIPLANYYCSVRIPVSFIELYQEIGYYVVRFSQYTQILLFFSFCQPKLKFYCYNWLSINQVGNCRLLYLILVSNCFVLYPFCDDHELISHRLYYSSFLILLELPLVTNCKSQYLIFGNLHLNLIEGKVF